MGLMVSWLLNHTYYVYIYIYVFISIYIYDIYVYTYVFHIQYPISLLVKPHTYNPLSSPINHTIFLPKKHLATHYAIQATRLERISEDWTPFQQLPVDVAGIEVNLMRVIFLEAPASKSKEPIGVLKPMVVVFNHPDKSYMKYIYCLC